VSRDFRFIDQIRSAATSVMSNIAEGIERDGNAEFRQFLYIAKASAGEVRSLLYVALDAGYIDESVFRKHSTQAFEVIRMTAGFIRYLEQSEMRGRKFTNNQ
jgi:four helix bundle protein